MGNNEHLSNESNSCFYGSPTGDSSVLYLNLVDETFPTVLYINFYCFVEYILISELYS